MSEGYTPTTKDVCDNYIFAEKYWEGGTDEEHQAEFYRWLDNIKEQNHE